MKYNENRIFEYISYVDFNRQSWSKLAFRVFVLWARLLVCSLPSSSFLTSSFWHERLQENYKMCLLPERFSGCFEFTNVKKICVFCCCCCLFVLLHSSLVCFDDRASISILMWAWTVRLSLVGARSLKKVIVGACEPHTSTFSLVWLLFYAHSSSFTSH